MFKFRLEPLITIRDNVLKEKQGELAKAYEARRKLEEKEAELNQELLDTIESGRQSVQNSVHGGEAISVDYLLSLRRHEGYLLAQKEHIAQTMVSVDEEIERRRHAVMEAHRELKTVEKLKEKKKEKYDVEENRKETVMLDEIALRTGEWRVES